MKKKIEKIYPFVPILIGVCFFVYLHSNIVLFGDDLVYRDNYNGRSVIQWSKEFYNSWGGRVPLQLLDNFFLMIPLIVWKIFNCILITLVMIYIYKYVNLFMNITDNKDLFLITCVISIVIGVIPTNIIKNSVLWVTGSFNYLLLAAMLIIALYPFLAIMNSSSITKFEKIIVWPCAFLCSYAEQTAAILLCMGGYCICYAIAKKKRVGIECLLLYGFGVVNSIIQFMAPGNSVRYDAEVLRWYQSYDMYNLFDRLILGVVHFMKNVLVTGLPYFIMILVIMGIMTVNKEKWVQIGYAILCGLTLYIYNFINNINDEVIWQIYDIKTLIGIAAVILWVLYFALMIIITMFDYFELASLIALCFLASIAAGVVIGMSPTVFASGCRVFLISYIMLSIVVVLYFSRLFCENEKKEIKYI